MDAVGFVRADNARNAYNAIGPTVSELYSKKPITEEAMSLLQI